MAMATFDDETQILVASTQRLQKDLAESKIPGLHACHGTLSAQQHLAMQVRDDLDVVTRQIEALDMLIDAQRRPQDRRGLQEMVDTLRDELARLRTASRTALLASKRAIDARGGARREELLRSTSLPVNATPGEEKATHVSVQNVSVHGLTVGPDSDDALMKANDDVTESLRRTIAIMQGELERSVLTSQMLDSSTATLRSTSKQHDTLEAFMYTSKQLITALEKSDWLDRLLILSAFSFFILVVLFILKQRFVDRGFRLAFGWTRVLPAWRGDMDIAGGKGVSRAGVVSGSSAVAVEGHAGVLMSAAVVAATTAIATAAAMATPTHGGSPSSATGMEEQGYEPSDLLVSAGIVGYDQVVQERVEL